MAAGGHHEPVFSRGSGDKATGGRGGGGTKVTPMGLDVLRRYRDMEAKAEASVRDEVAAFAELLSEDAHKD